MQVGGVAERDAVEGHIELAVLEAAQGQGLALAQARSIGALVGDATDLHHTSSALFIAHDIGEAQIDRGPGTASTIGNATFGGSMNFLTKAPLRDLTVNPYATIGSFDTYAGGAELDTGQTTGIGALFFDGQYESSNGYLTHASENRANFMMRTSIR